MVTQSRLLDQIREKIRLKHYSIRTEQAYLDWIKRFILFLWKHRYYEKSLVIGADRLELLGSDHLS